VSNYIENPQGSAKPIGVAATNVGNLIDFGEVINENSKASAKKFDPFEAFPNKSTTQSNKPTVSSNGESPNTSPLQPTTQAPPQSKPVTNSLFVGLNSKQSAPTTVTNVPSNSQPTETKQKGNAFDFIKGGKQQNTNTAPTTQSKPNTNDLLGLNFGGETATKPSNILNMYGQPTAGAPTQDANLLNMNFGVGTTSNTSPVTSNPGPYPYGYNYPPHGYSMPPQGFYPPQPMGYPPTYPPSYNYPTSQPPKDDNSSYDKFAKEVQNGVALISLSEEQKKQEQANKQKKDDMDKYFDFIKL